MQKLGDVVMLSLDGHPIYYLAGSKMVAPRSWPFFNNLQRQFLEELLERIREDKRSVDFPDLISFCFSFRKAIVDKLAEDYYVDKLRFGLGLAFHITPSNVPMNFAYSFIFSFLSGNSNIVKVSSRTFPQVEIFCSIFKELIKNEKYLELKDSNLLIQYASDEKTTRHLSLLADTRIVWGSDQTINTLKSIPSKVRSRDIFFSDRFSICLIESSSLLKCTDQELGLLVKRFYNDTFSMDQNACSSPSMVVWVGETAKLAKERFWTALNSLLNDKYEIQTSQVMDKLTQLYTDAILNVFNKADYKSKKLYRIQLDELTRTSYRGKSGYFYEYSTNNLDDLIPVLNSGCQTITYAGDIRPRIAKLLKEKGIQGVDRVVPIGSALEMGPIWDGYDLFRSLSRVVNI